MVESGRIKVGLAILLGLWVSKNRKRLRNEYSVGNLVLILANLLGIIIDTFTNTFKDC